MEGKSYFLSGKTCGLHAKATVTSTSVHLALEVWVWEAPALRCLWFQYTQEDEVVAGTKEIRCHLILTLNSCAEAQPSLGDGAYYIPVVMRWQLCNSNLGLYPAGQRAKCPPVLPARQTAPERTVRVTDKHLHLYLHVWAHIFYTPTYIPTDLPTHMHTYTHTYIPIHIHIHILIHVTYMTLHTYVHISICVCVGLHTHVYTCICVCIFTFLHAYIHTYGPPRVPIYIWKHIYMHKAYMHVCIPYI